MNRAAAKRAPAGAGARAGYARKKGPAAWGAPKPAAARTEGSGTERDGGNDMQEQNRKASAAAWRT